MVTIIIPVSRMDYLNQLFESLEALECDKENTNLLVYVDGDLRLFEKARNLTVASKFKERLCVYRRKGMANVGSIMRRRQRIADIHNELQGILKECDYVFLIEDDTLVPVDALTKLLAVFDKHPNAGFVSGLELGRWGYIHIGAWRVDDPVDTAEIVSIANTEAVEEVDAAGLYCCLIKKDNYIRHRFQPFEKILGPDVDFGLTLREYGFRNYIDGSIKCTHLNKKESFFFDKPIIKIRFMRISDSKTGWEMEVIPE